MTEKQFKEFLTKHRAAIAQDKGEAIYRPSHFWIEFPWHPVPSTKKVLKEAGFRYYATGLYAVRNEESEG